LAKTNTVLKGCISI